jgi:hypothetical protein
MSWVFDLFALYCFGFFDDPIQQELFEQPLIEEDYLEDLSSYSSPEDFYYADYDYDYDD